MLSNAIRMLVRCTVETYIVPGTTAGSQILWIYLISWKREMLIFCYGLSSLIFSGDVPGGPDMTAPMANSETRQ